MKLLVCAAALHVLSFAANAQVSSASENDGQLARASAGAAAFRSQPVQCRRGEIEYFAGKTLADVFGDAWPVAPPSTQFERPKAKRMGAMQWPRGLGQDGASVLTATLVGPDGRAVDARALCATVPAISEPAVRAAMGGRYTPAKFDGVPGMGIFFNTWRFRIREDQPPPRRQAP